MGVKNAIIKSADKTQKVADRIDDLIDKSEREGHLEKAEFMELQGYMSDKQKLFCDYYSQTGDGIKSTERAGYQASGTMAGNLLRDPKVKLYLKELLQIRKEANEVTATMILVELRDMVFFDPTTVFEFNDQGVPMVKADNLRKSGKYIKKLKYNIKSKNLELEFYDRMDAIEKLAKHIGFYEKDNEQKKTELVAIFLPDNGRGTKDIQHVELPIDNKD